MRKVMLIVGAGPGLGRTLAIAAARTGWDVALVARRPGPIEETAALVESAGGSALALPADATDADAMAEVVAAVMARWGRIDSLVHSLLPPHLFRRVLAMDRDELAAWRRSVEISTYGALVSAYHAAPPMVAAGCGSLVFVTATSGLQSYPAISSHAVGKAGIHALMQSLASELGEHGVRANAVAVGSIEGATKRALPPFDDPEVARDMTRARAQSVGALGRLVNEQEAADAILFLASAQSAGMTGQIMAVDGGRIFH